jgi:hypothetical protein
MPLIEQTEENKTFSLCSSFYCSKAQKYSRIRIEANFVVF